MRRGRLVGAVLGTAPLASLLGGCGTTSCESSAVGFAKDAVGEETVDAALEPWAKTSPNLPQAGWQETSRRESSGLTSVTLEQDDWTVGIVDFGHGWLVQGTTHCLSRTRRRHIRRRS